jgi:hypothetical protein
MTEITTVAQLEALPVSATVMSDPEGFAYRKVFGGRFIQLGDDGTVPADHLLKAYPSFRVVYMPDRWADAFEQLHRRITRDLNWEASESAAPEDERWARTLDDLRQFADDLRDKTEGEA